MDLLHTTRLYITLPLLYFTLLDCTLLYNDSTSLYIALPWLYVTLHYSTRGILHSTSLYINLPWIYLRTEHHPIAPLPRHTATTISCFFDLMYPPPRFHFPDCTHLRPQNLYRSPLGFLFVVPLRPLEHSLQ